MMRAVGLKSFGSVANFCVEEVPKPEILNENTDVIIKVMAAGVNRADTMQRRGAYPPPPGESDILGLEVSGVIEAIGANVSQSNNHNHNNQTLKVGDKVMALLGGGGYAEYVRVHCGSVMPMPANLDFIQAAAIPETFLTSWQCLHMHGKAQAGQNILLHAGASGIGTAASQIIEKYYKATAITTSSAEKVNICKQFASVCVDRTPQVTVHKNPTTNEEEEVTNCFAPKVLDALKGRENPWVDLIIDPVFGGSYLRENAMVLTSLNHSNQENGGKLVVLATMAGATVDQKELNFAPFFAKSATIQFTKLRSKSAAYKEELVQSFAREVLPLIEAGEIKAVVHKTFPLEEVGAAHSHLEGSDSWGKTILIVDKELQQQTTK